MKKKHIINYADGGWWVNQAVTDLDSPYLENRAAFWGPHAKEFALEHAKKLNVHPDFVNK